VLSQTSEYALRAMTFLTEQGESPMTSQAISEATQVPKHYLSKVLRMLVLAELITATRGPTGGFQINRDRPPITVLDVVNAVDPIQRIAECPLGRPDHTDLCPLHRMMNQTIDQVIRSMEQVRIEQLCESFVPSDKTDQPPGRTRS
jgi:Rrf2 family protein